MYTKTVKEFGRQARFDDEPCEVRVRARAPRAPLENSSAHGQRDSPSSRPDVFQTGRLGHPPGAGAEAGLHRA